MSNQLPLIDSPTTDITQRWHDFLLARYHHYSGKTVNSNVPACGVRLGCDQALKLPHLSGRTLLADRTCGSGVNAGLVLDYISQGASKDDDLGTTATNRQVRHWLGQDVNTDNLAELPDSSVNQLVSLYRDMERGGSPGAVIPDPLPKRLKQILLPRPDGSFVAVTPLPSLQVAKDLYEYCRHVYESRAQLNKDYKKLSGKKKGAPEDGQRIDEIQGALNRLPRFARLTKLPVGGSNSQNVGGQAFNLTRPIVFDRLPQATADQRKAFGIAYNGLRFYFPKALVTQYRQFLNRLREERGGSLSTWTVPMIDSERPYLQVLMRAWVFQAQHAKRLLSEYVSSLPSPYPYQATSSDAARFDGWLGVAERTHKWKQGEALMFARALKAIVLGVNDQGEAVTLGLSETDVRRIADSVLKGGVL